MLSKGVKFMDMIVSNKNGVGTNSIVLCNDYGTCTGYAVCECQIEVCNTINIEF